MNLSQLNFLNYLKETSLKRKMVKLGKKGYTYLQKDLIQDNFIFASTATGNFHHYFGRDTAFNAWYLHIAYADKKDEVIWQKTKSAILHYWNFQQSNGKIPHELKPYHPDDHLGKMGFYEKTGDFFINWDSVDSTPLLLIVTPLYLEENSEEFKKILPKALSALQWIENNLNAYNGLLCYESNPKGLTSQGWMDSKHGGAVDEDGNPIYGPIALVEAQAFAWKAFMLWADILQNINPEKSLELREKAKNLKEMFNKSFLIRDDKGSYFSHALVLESESKEIKNRINAVSINAGFCLWASHLQETIINSDYLIDTISRLLSSEMFDEKAGVFTFARGHALKNGDGYHNGEQVVWPFAAAAVAYGVMQRGENYVSAGLKMLRSSLMPVIKSGSFIEQATYTIKGTFVRHNSGTSFISCEDQTWTITAYLAALKTLGLFEKMFTPSRARRVWRMSRMNRVVPVYFPTFYSMIKRI